MNKVLVTGAAGFIGSHLVKYLKERGYWVRAVDYRPPRFEASAADECDWTCDLRSDYRAFGAVQGVDQVYALAADMGGAGFVFTGQHDMEIMANNTEINLNTLAAAHKFGVKRYLFSSSACVYPEHLQMKADSSALCEKDAYPAAPDSEYGWEKLYTERLCQVYAKASDMEVRIVRFHNVYGPQGSWNDGREKVPAAFCRKIADAKLSGNPEIEIWGDGEQVRSFMYIDDCLEGLVRLMQSDIRQPLNLGRDRAVSINQLADIIAEIAGIEIKKKHIEGPQGVRWRNSDNSLCKQLLGWNPSIPLEEGLVPTYQWIETQVEQ